MLLPTSIFYTALGFFSGSILYSYFIPKLFLHIDICTQTDDHNPGAYNAFKRCGPFWGVLLALLDVLKAAVPVYLAVTRAHLFGWYLLAPVLSPVLGHAFSPFRHFKGGKAIAAFFGVLIGLLPVTPLLWICIVCILSLLPFVRDHSLLMCAGVSLFCALTFLLVNDVPMKTAALLLSALIYMRHYPQARTAIDALRSRWAARRLP